MKHIFLAATALVPAWSAASAQDVSRDLRVRVGLGAQVQPKFVGADSYRISPLPRVNIAHGTEQFRFTAPDDSVSIPILTSGGFSFGPAASIAARRKDSDVGVPIGKVPTTFEAGAFVQYVFGDTLRLRGEVLKGIGGHDGLTGQIGADKIWRDGDRYVFSVGPRVLFSNARYQRAYFGVTPAASLATGLAQYRPSGGIEGVGVSSGLTYQLSDRFGMFGYARYERLVGNAAKSPLIRAYGSRTQLSGGVGLSYTFIVHR